MDSDKYSDLIEPHRRALSQLELDLEFFFRDVGAIDVFSVSSRIKKIDSAIQKSNRLNVKIDDLDDLAGMRIIVGTQNEIPVVEQFFKRQEYGKDLSLIKRNDFKRKSGYRATHFVVELKSSYKRSIHIGRVEVQLQTVFGSAFNYLSRSWIYKSSFKMNDKWNAKFLELSNVLSELEGLAGQLHAETIEAASLDDSAALTPHTFRVIAKEIFNETVKFDSAVDYCRWYWGLGYKTNGHLKIFFQDKEVHDLYEYVHLRSPESQALSRLYSLGKISFWCTFGSRISFPGTREFIESLAHNGDASNSRVN